MFCNKCGTKIPDGQTVCPNCGASQSEPAQPANQAAPAQTIIVRQSNGCATAGFVLGIFGFIFPTGLLQLVGLILSIVGVVKAKSVNGTGRGMAIAGIVLCTLSLLVVFMAIFLFLPRLLFIR